MRRFFLYHSSPNFYFSFYSNFLFYTVSLILSLIFFAWFISALVRGKVSYQNSDFCFREHPLQFIILVVAILGFALFCLNRFLNDMGIHLF